MPAPTRRSCLTCAHRQGSWCLRLPKGPGTACADSTPGHSDGCDKWKAKPARPITPQIPAPSGCAPLGIPPDPTDGSCYGRGVNCSERINGSCVHFPRVEAALQSLEAAARRPTPRFDLAHRQEELF